ncbi:MAG: cache domain-containing protein [Desulfosarcinaceae bacterium]|nr:cache domain-containing protein [Desulfosarcinaceae bacterium]
MQATMVICRCKSCGKAYQVDLGDIDTRYGRFTCGQCNTVTMVENPKFSGSASGADHPGPESTTGSDDSGTPDFDALFAEDDHAALDDPADLLDDAFDDALTPQVPAKEAVSRRGMSIRSKITLVIVLLVLGALTAVGMIASTESRSALSEQAEAHLVRVAQQKADEYSLIFQRINQEVEAVADYAREIYATAPAGDIALGQYMLMPWNGSTYGDPVSNPALKSETLILQRVVRLLKPVVAKNPYVILGYLGTETNVMALDDQAAVLSIGATDGFVNTKRPWYVKAITEGKTVWTAPYVDANSKDLIVTCATPVRSDAGNVLGVVGYDVLLSTIQKDILTLTIGYDSYAMLVDGSGKVLVRPGIDAKDTRWNETYDSEDLTKTDNAAFKGIIANMMAGKSGIESFVSDGGGRYAAYAPLDVIGASLAIIASQPAVVQPAKEMQTYIMIVWAVVLVIAIIIGVLIGNGITRPINQLTHMADQVSQGQVDLDVLPENRTDEIGSLTRSFNRLVISLKMALTR